MPSISYAITACNEHVELERLLNQLDRNIRDIDEVVIQLDATATPAVEEVCYKYPAFTLIQFPLNNDFASFKNNLKNKCNQDYIFQIDADEYPHPELLESLPSILEANDDTDVFLVPRINIVEGLTEQHIQKWGWNITGDSRVNFPDYQWRIWKNIPKIKWINKVHERLDGFGLYTNFPPLDEMCLYHPKTIDRQEKQNNYYNTI
jgi:glycosyltransferase involved in cell wall biosynthesis